MLSPSLMASRAAADAQIRDKLPPRIRPARRAWRLDGLEFSRAELIRTWQIMKEPTRNDLPEGRVYFHEGHGCTTSAKHGAREGREVRTLRELLQVARLDHIRPNLQRGRA